MEKRFLSEPNYFISVRFEFSLKSSIVIFTFTSSGSKDFNFKLVSLISYIYGGNVYAIVDPAIYFTSNMSIISS